MARAKHTSPAESDPAAAETGGTLTIDLAAIVANWQALTRQLLTVECAAVVKANAYGLGLKPVVAALAGSAGLLLAGYVWRHRRFKSLARR